MPWPSSVPRAEQEAEQGNPQQVKLTIVACAVAGAMFVQAILLLLLMCRLRTRRLRCPPDKVRLLPSALKLWGIPLGHVKL